MAALDCGKACLKVMQETPKLHMVLIGSLEPKPKSSLELTDNTGGLKGQREVIWQLEMRNFSLLHPPSLENFSVKGQTVNILGFFFFFSNLNM